MRDRIANDAHSDTSMPDHEEGTGDEDENTNESKANQLWIDIHNNLSAAHLEAKE